MNKNPMVSVGGIMSVYSGIDGRCCCGCSGKHTYASFHRKAAGKDRGYVVGDHEVSDRTVALIVNKINRLLKEGKGDIACSEYVSAVNGNRLYVAYFVKK